MALLLVRLLQLYVIVLFVRAVFSWIQIGPDSPFAPVARVVYDLTEPVLAPVRSIMPRTGMIDLSFLVVLVIINYVMIPLVARLPF